MCLGDMECVPIVICILMFGYVFIQATCDDYDDWFKALSEYDAIEEFVPLTLDKCPEEFDICKEHEFCELIKIDSSCEPSDIRCVTKRKAVCNNVLQPASNQIMIERGDTIRWQANTNTHMDDDASSYQDPEIETSHNIEAISINPSNLAQKPISKPPPTLFMDVPQTEEDYLAREKRNTSNCEYYPSKDTYKCKNWNSLTIGNDITHARRAKKSRRKRKYHLKIYKDNITDIMSEVIENNFNITSGFSVANTEWVTRFIYIPCVNHMTLMYNRLTKLKNVVTSGITDFNDFKLMRMAVEVQKTCNMPLTPLRKTILMDLINIFIKKSNQSKTKKFFTMMANRVTLRSSISPSKENSFFQKAIRRLYRKLIIDDTYSETMIRSIINEENVIPEVDDQIIDRRIKKIQAKLDYKTSPIKMIEEIHQTMRKSDVR